jgi:hypothetical protein
MRCLLEETYRDDDVNEVADLICRKQEAYERPVERKI